MRKIIIFGLVFIFLISSVYSADQLAYYDFEDNFLDSWSSYDLSPVGVTTTSAHTFYGGGSKSVILDAVTDYIQLDSSPFETEILTEGDFSFCLSIHPVESNTDQKYYFVGLNSGNLIYNVRVQNNEFVSNLRQTDSSYSNIATTTANIQDDTDYRFCFVTSDFDSITSIYLDGDFLQSGAWDGTFYSPNDDGSNIGNSKAQTDAFIGYIDEVKFWLDTMTQTDIDNDYANYNDDSAYIPPSLINLTNFYDSSFIDDFKVKIINSTDTTYVTTTNGSVYYSVDNEAVSIDIYEIGGNNNLYFNYSKSNYNLSVGLTASAYQSVLIIDAYDGLAHQDIESFSFEIEDGEVITQTNTSNSSNLTTFYTNADDYTYEGTKSGFVSPTGSVSILALEIKEIMVNFTEGSTNVYGPFNSTVAFNTVIITADCDVQTYIQISQNSSTFENLSNDYIHSFDSEINGFYLSIDSSVCSWTELSTTNEPAPNITLTTPSNYSFTITEGDTVNFNVTAESNLTLSYGWFIDSILKATTQFYQWVTGFTDDGLRSVEVVVTDEYGQTDSQQFNVTVLNVNFVPVINDLDISEYTLYQNIDYNILCDLTDDSNSTSDLIVEIQWNDGSGWTDTTESYVSGNIWKSVIIANTHSQDDIISYRCSGTDIDTVPLTSAYYYRNDLVMVLQEETPPTQPSYLFPQGSEHKLSIPLACYGSFDNQTNQVLSYEMQIRKNSSSWIHVKNNTGILLFPYNIYDDGLNTLYDTRCRAYDGIELSNWIYSYNASIRKNMPLLKITQPGDFEVYLRNRPYQLSLFSDVEDLNNITIIKSFVDCQNDGIWDSYEDYEFKETNSFTFSCVNTQGLKKHTAGVILYKNDTTPWRGVCSALPGTTQECIWKKTFDVVVK